MDEFRYDIDPLSRIYHELTTNCVLIININTPNEIIKDIAGFIGYIESKLKRKALNAYTNTQIIVRCVLIIDAI